MNYTIQIGDAYMLYESPNSTMGITDYGRYWGMPCGVHLVNSEAIAKRVTGSAARLRRLVNRHVDGKCEDTPDA